MAPNNSMQALPTKVQSLQSLLGEVEAKDSTVMDTESKTTNGEVVASSDDAGKSTLQEPEPPKNEKSKEMDVQDELKKIDKEIDDISEGEDVDLFHEYFLSGTGNKKTIKRRIKLAQKRRHQHHSYINIVEERLQVLEEAYKDLEMRTRKKGEDEEDDDDDEDKKTLKYDLNPQVWVDFNKYREPSSTFHVIDILVEEPEYSRDSQASTNKGSALSTLLNIQTPEDDFREAKEHSKEAKVEEVGKLVENLKGVRLPERIRFNCMALQHLLRKFFHAGEPSARSFVEARYIMLRPYKPLSQFEHEIKGLMEDVLKLIENIRRTGNANGEGKEDKSEDGVKKHKSSDTEQRDSPSDPDQPLTITKQQWINIFRELDLFDDEGPIKVVVEDWPTDVEVKKTFQCLLEFMDQYMKPVTEKIQNRETDKIRFADLWHLFRSGDEIVTNQILSKDKDKAMAMRVLRINGGRRHLHPTIAPSFDSTRLPEPEHRVQPVNGVNPFAVHAWYIDFDGSHLSPVRKRIVIQPYVGERDITALEVYPIKYAPNYKELKASLIARGKRFVKIVQSPTTSYCDCYGEVLDTKEEINDKVIVDMKEYDKVYDLPGYTEPDALDMSETSNCPQGLDCISGPECFHTSIKIVHDQYTEKAAMKAYVESQPIFQQFSNAAQREKLVLAEDDYALCNYRLFAYKLRSRDWVQIHVGSLADVSLEDKEKGFERLVLPSGHKHIIKSQVKEHFRKKAMANSAAQDDLDLVRGKGQGLIILLHGAPGVGKTCTAETIADLVHKPLYPITCGDLGSTAMEVEKNLKQHFTLASKWDCVMLLDEADVFLAKRKSDDLHRNSIVSVFLRIMEYYKGLLFLTTNRVGTFDEAFKSRVHISLFYSEFDQKATVEVWETFIRQTEEAIKRKGRTHFEIRKKEIKKFAKEHWKENPRARWNGRQIRNAFHTAIAMAEFDAREHKEGRGQSSQTLGEGTQEAVKIVLGRAQFEKIASTVKDFDRYMERTIKGTYEGYADKDRLRAMNKAEEAGKKAKKSKKQVVSSSEESSSSSSDPSDGEKKEDKESSKNKKRKKSRKAKPKIEKEDSGSSSSSSDSDSD